MKIAIIGGVAAGTSAAAKASRENEEAEIVLFEKGKNISYAGCGLPYYISGMVDSRDQVEINTPEAFTKKYGVKVKTEHRVTDIDPDNKIIRYKNLSENKSGTYNYDKLIITTGASPVVPPIPGSDLDKVMTLRTLKDAEKIKNKIENHEIKNVCIVGGGLIGLEMAESFNKKNLRVTVIEKLPQVLPQFDHKTAKIVAKHLKKKKVNLILNDGVKKISKKNNLLQINTEKEQKVLADLVLMSVGIRPEVELAQKAGLDIGNTGAIGTNPEMRTSEPDIYTAGDCAESINLITGKPVWFPLGSTANKQGRIAGENAAGGKGKHRGILKTAITKIFELTVARTGLSEEEAEKEGFNIITINIEAAHHAGYYPEVEKINLKGIFDTETERIIGAEAVGKAGVDKRIDVLSTAIFSQLTAHDLFEIDLAYAPPYSSPKDPVAVLGMVAEKNF